MSHERSDIAGAESFYSLEGSVCGTVAGIANEHSIAAGCAQAFRDAGADLVLTCREKSMSFVRPVANAIKPRLLLPLDVETDGALESVFNRIQSTFGRLDFVLHSIAFCPKQDFRGRVTDCSREGFARAMDVSVHSFIRMARLAEPLMQAGGCLLTVSHYGAEKVVDHYNIMGPGEIGSRGNGALSCRRARTARHSCQRPLTRPAQDASSVRDRSPRRAD